MDSETNHSTTHKLIITEWLTLAAVLIACFLFLFSEMKNIECRLDIRMQAQGSRTDRLYEMFVDLLKNQKESRS